MLTDQAFTRYQRQIALPEFGEEGQQRLSNSHVLIIGCGGLGSAASLYLTAAGIGHMVLVDDDSVESSNLQRQVVYRHCDIGKQKVDAIAGQLFALNPDVRLRTLNHRLDERQLELEVMLADVVLDCTDNIATRQIINRVCFEQKTVLISAAAIGWQGQFAVFDYVNGTACYRCLYPFDELKNDQSCSQMGVIGPIVGTLGNYQAIAAIQKLALEKFIVATGQLHLFDGKTLLWQSISITQDTQCLVCSSKESAYLGEGQ